MTTEVPLAACPSCKGPVAKGAEHRPFCSDRCRLVDLGRWMNEDFVVTRPLREDDLPEDFDPEAPPEEESTDP